MTKRSNKRQRGWGIGLFLSLLMVFSVEAKKNELVIATTFSPDATAYIISRWQTQPQSVIIR
ncbi:MAG: ABC transporter substrate-binding protein, partial [Raoultella planticola]